MPSRQVFYTHIMKTGGTSLSRVLRACIPDELTYPTGESDEGQVVAKTFSNLLLGLDPKQQRALQLVSVHQPAWVAAAVSPQAHTLTVLREPISRTVSHLRQLRASVSPSDDLEAIYADDGWRARLANHQTQLFADTKERNEDLDAFAPGEELDENVQEALRHELTQFWETGISRPMEIGDEDYARAAAVLETYDCVGVTEDLPGMTRRVAELTGLDLPPVPHANAGAGSDAVSHELLERIRADNEYDLRLYEHAQRLAERPCPTT